MTCNDSNYTPAIECIIYKEKVVLSMSLTTVPARWRFIQQFFGHLPFESWRRRCELLEQILEVFAGTDAERAEEIHKVEQVQVCRLHDGLVPA